tara:strand:- start:5613 stop:6038 length:426 start_codon:yes stop_codon:yes gene_type:complete
MEDKKLTFEEIMPLVIEMCDGEDGEGVYGFCDEGVYYDVPADFEPLPEGSEYDYDLGRQRDTNYANTQPLGHTERMASHGGEGEGEDYWSVWYFDKHDVYIKVQGYYQSYNGTEFEDGWDSCFEVVPEEVMVTVYNEKKKV